NLQSLVTIILRLKRPFNCYANIISLFFGKFSKFNANFFKVKFRYFFIQMFWKHIYFVFIVFAIFPKFNLRQSLVGKTVAHHKTWVAGGTTKVYQTAFGQKDNVFSANCVFVNLWLYFNMRMSVVFL